MKTKTQWSEQFGEYKKIVGGIDMNERRVTPEMVKQIQKEAMEECAHIVFHSGLPGEAVKNIYKRIERL